MTGQAENPVGNASFGGLTLRLVAEFAVIVIGVMTALAADGWVSSMADRELEAEYLQRLEEELTGHLDEILLTIRLDRTGFEAAEVLLSVLPTRDVPPAGVSELATLGLRTSLNYQFNSRLDTYEELLSSGRIGLLRNPEIRTALAEYAALSHEFEPFWDYARREYWRRIMGAVHPRELRSYFDTCVAPGAAVEAAESPVACPSNLSPSSQDAVMRILADPEVVSQLHFSMWYQSQTAQILDEQFRPVVEGLLAEIRTP